MKDCQRAVKPLILSVAGNLGKTLPIGSKKKIKIFNYNNLPYHQKNINALLTMLASLELDSI